LRTAIEQVKTLTDHRLLVPMDAGKDAQDTPRVCLEADVDFVIKRNLRRESKELHF
jgi:hypothetical protein